MKPYIKLENCKDGYTYLIHARNGIIGIFHEQEYYFELSRFKFDNNYVFEEFHYDTGEPFGTVMPELEIEKTPPLLSDKEKLKYLNNLTKVYFSKENDKNISKW